MGRIAYVNGRYVPHDRACVHIEDRGYQLADAVYEVCEIWNGAFVDPTAHLNRLDRSLAALSIAAPMRRGALMLVLREVVRRNRIRDGLVYLQVSRGVARRDHGFPVPSVPPSLVVTARRIDPQRMERLATDGVAVVTRADDRWARVDIKTVSLLPNVLAKQAAREAGAYEAWLVDGEGYVTEGASTNAWIVTGDGALVTRPAERGILRGVTRMTVLDLARHLGLQVEERPFTVAEAMEAREAFATSATSLVLPIVRIDDRPVANGAPGSIALELRRLVHSHAETIPV